MIPFRYTSIRPRIPPRLCLVTTRIYHHSLLNPLHPGYPPMPNLNASLSCIVTGDNITLNFIIGNIPPGDPCAKAWFTVKADPNDPDTSAVFQKTIDSTATPAGIITDDGATTGEAVLIFQVLPAESNRLAPDTSLNYDVQIKTAAGMVYTAEIGSLYAVKGITDNVL